MKHSLRRLQFVLPLILGAAAFLAVVGPKALNPQNINWLLNGDPFQHFLGWGIFQHGPYTFPLGLNPNYGLGISSSVVFSDSIPLAAIFFKIFRFILPEPFQYFGLWTLLCFILQAWFGWLLVGLITNNLTLRFFSTGLFVFSPVLLWRVGMHTALVSHFLILAALYLNFRVSNHWRSVLWAILISVSAFIHFYLLTMVIALWLANYFDQILIQERIKKKEGFFEAILVLCVLGISVWQAGYFAINTRAGAGNGFGTFQINLFSIIDPQGWSYIINNVGIYHATLEDYSYLGLGTLFIIFFLLLRARYLKKPQANLYIKFPFLLFTLFFFLCLAITHNLYVGSVTVHLPLSDWIGALLDVVRASGRFIWPAYYCFLLALCYLIVHSSSKKLSQVILGIAFFIQVIDTSAGWLPMRKSLMRAEPPKPIEALLPNPFWQNAFHHYKNIKIVPLVNSMLQNEWDLFSYAAYLNKLGTNAVYLARFDLGKVFLSNHEYLQQLSSGKFDPDSIYIIDNWNKYPNRVFFNPDTDLLAKIDGFNVLAPNWKKCKQCVQIPKEMELNDHLAQVINLNQMISFVRPPRGEHPYLLSGWANNKEAWGTWSNGHSAGLLLPLPMQKPKTLELVARAFVNSNHPTQDLIISIDGKPVKSVTLSNSDNNIIDIPLPLVLPDKNYLFLQIELLNPASPKQLGGASNDGRQLGIGLISARYY